MRTLGQETHTQTPALPFAYTVSPAVLCFSKRPPSHMPLRTKIERFDLQGVLADLKKENKNLKKHFALETAFLGWKGYFSPY